MVKIGQRWMYTDTNYMWVVEVTAIAPRIMGKIIQVLKDKWLENEGHTSYPIGSPIMMTGAAEGKAYWQHLEGQNRPEGDQDD